MEEKKMIEIIYPNNKKELVEEVTYLNSSDSRFQYLVYSKGEVQNAANEEIIYISKVSVINNEYKLEEIEEDGEWQEVLHLLKEIANKKEIGQE